MPIKLLAVRIHPGVRRALLVALTGMAIVLFFALRGGGGGDQAVAHVGGEPIGKSRLEAVVAHFRTEAAKEGKPFPSSESSDAGRRVRNTLLGLLVYREELRQAAKVEVKLP